MNKKQLMAIYSIIVCLYPSVVGAITFDDMLVHHPSGKKPFWGYAYKNIKWVSHTPHGGAPAGGEADYRGQVDVGKVDLDKDNRDEIIKVTWGLGISEHSLTIEIYKGNKNLAILQPKGIQPNFKIEDIDSDGKLEIVLWGAVGDPKMSQLAADESKPFEGHSDPHLFIVSIYKLTDAGYKLSREYTSRKKYEPFCEEMPKE